MIVAVLPELSVTVRRTTQVFADAYAWVGLMPLPVAPSPMGLASTLHDMFLVAAAVAAVAVVASMFLRSVPLSRSTPIQNLPEAVDVAA